MSAIPPSVLCMTQVAKKIELHGNPWQCDCRMAPVKLIDAFESQITCAKPAKVQGRKLVSVNWNELGCEDSTISTSAPSIQVTSHNSHYHWYFRSNAVPTVCPADKTKTTLISPHATTLTNPESAPSVPIPVLIGSVCSSVAGTVVIVTFLALIWYKRRTRNPPLGLNPGVVGTNTNSAASVIASSHHQRCQAQAITESNTNATATVMASGDDHQYEDIDNPRVKTGQGQSQANAESSTNTTATVMTSGHDQTGQSQSQANAESSTNNTATVMTSGHDQTGQSQSQANIQSLKVGSLSNNKVLAALQPNPMYVDVKTLPKDDASTDIANSNDQTGKGQSQAVTESLDVRNLSYGTGPTGSQQNSVYKAVTQSQTITNTAVVMTCGNVQTGQGQYQAITESLDARNLSYGTGPTASQLNSVYRTATVMSSGQDQSEQGQSQVITESNTNTTATVMAIDHYFQYDDFENKAKQGQSNTNTTATVMTSGQDDIGQANAQSPTIANLPRNEVLAALQPNPMYQDVKTPPKNPTCTEIASGHD
ncbi:Leucine-rich repeats, typical (most populated) sub-containing protein [Branchiostoma belcheri]|nr:Leucine-rich repeats, typical (most populated) sub-containing protein [Branchiostoma belcheri]